MLKSAILTLVLCLATGLSYAQGNSELRKFRTGKFYYPLIPDASLVVRTKHRQIEYGLKNNAKSVLKIKWLNDSTYVLTLLSTTYDIPCFRKGLKLTTKITSHNGNEYSFHTSSKCVEFDAVMVKKED